jgi:hypothetical protein
LLRDALTASWETQFEVLEATVAEARAASRLQQMLRPHWFTPSQRNAKGDIE